MKRILAICLLCAVILISGCSAALDTQTAAEQVNAAFASLLDAEAYHIRYEVCQDDDITQRVDTWRSGNDWYQTGDKGILLYCEGQWLAGSQDASASPGETIYLLKMNVLELLDPAFLTVSKAEQSNGETIVTAASDGAVTVVYVLSPDGALRTIEKRVAMSDGSTVIDRLTVESLDETAIAAAIAEKVNG